MKKIISLVLALVMVVSIAAVSTMSVSAAAVDGTVYKWNAEDYHYGWGEQAEKIEYSKNGFITLTDTKDRFTRQFQASYQIDDAPTAKAIEAKIDLANAEYSGIVSIKMHINKCSSSNYTIGDATLNSSGAQLKFFISYRYKDPENYDEDLNPEAWTSMQFARDGFVNFDQDTTFKIPVDGYLDYLEGAADPDLNYSDFQIRVCQVHVMGYCFNAFKSDAPNYAYQAGVKDVDVTFSSPYIDDLGCPEEKGDNLGTCVEFVPNAEDPAAAGKFIINGKEYPQVDDGTQKDGPFGNGAGANIPVMQFGDANEDGNINAKDTLLMRKFVAKQKVTLNESCSDVIIDGTINAKDVLRLRKFVAKQKVVLGEYTPKSEF